MKAPKVAIIMGSDSDFPIMKPAQQVLEELGIDSETRIVSAHRMPDRMFEFAKQAESLGFNVIIAGRLYQNPAKTFVIKQCFNNNHAGQ